MAQLVHESFPHSYHIQVHAFSNQSEVHSNFQNTGLLQPEVVEAKRKLAFDHDMTDAHASTAVVVAR